MIYLLLEGHDAKYQLLNLIKVFFPIEEITNINNENEYIGQGMLIIVSLKGNNFDTYAESKLYLDGILVKKSTEKINRIEIYEKNLEKNIKIGLRKTLFEVLEEFADRKTSWGILTGIRPMKIVHELMDKKLNDIEIINTLRKEYKFTKDKSELVLDIGKKQRKYIYPLDENKFSLYVSIPFCPSRCLYCSFPSLSISKYIEYVDSYTNKLIYEINKVSEMLKNKTINTVYIGGGTPTALPIKNLEKIIQTIYKKFGEKNIKEFTVEAGRPDTLNIEYLKMLRNNRIDRISINPQTMNDKTLKLIGRNHSVNQVIEIYSLAKELGFKVINMDLIIGLPGEGMEEIKRTLDKIKRLDPENLTVHTLAIKTRSKLMQTIEEYPLKSQEQLINMFREMEKYAKEMKLIAYYLYRQKRILGNLENIGYSKENMECIYNISMMEEKETIIGVGMGAVSKIYFPAEDKIYRVPNFKNLHEYLNRIDENIYRKHIILNDN